jgi:hypothetical protein
MPGSVERLPDEPILIARYTGKVIVDDVRHVFERSAELISADDKVVFRVTDMVHSDTDFGEVLKMARELGSGVPGSTGDTRIRAAIVGRGRWAKLFADTIQQKQFGGFHIPLFKDMDDALAYARLEIARLNNPSVESEA